MRRFVVFFSIVLLATGSASAQHPRLGIKAGLNASTYTGAELPHSDYRFGGAAGLLLQRPLLQHLGLQSELLYEQRGSELKYTNSTEGVTFTTIDYIRTVRSRLHYGSLAVLLRPRQGTWFAVAGPQFSYLLAEKRTIQDQVNVIVGPVDPVLPDGSARIVRNKQEYNRGEVGYVVGIGREVGTHWQVEGRYAAGFTKLRQPTVAVDAVYGSERVQHARSQSLQVQISYLLSSQ
ncbi:porin family protein [Hymenobacter sp. YC55]|uniref:porin family protein n=1 Tax=Hymenobacter sp. YC55 TaxID=3034019 RepID=UPI0023F9EDB0|nr:porin family protein [Hymenobacter sp. YC55]MDF7814971.1 porin family protein [Hymenobacter sp. YC55]